MIKAFSLVGASLLAVGSAAHASTFTYVHGAAGAIPGALEKNDVLESAGAEQALGYFGSQISLADDNGGTGYDITVDFFGFEAGFVNSFVFDGNTLFDTESSDPEAALIGDPGRNNELPSDFVTPLATTVVNGVTNGANGFLNFSFDTADTAESAVNGLNPINDVNSPVNFFVSSLNYDNYVWLFYDDNGAGNDDNHDDFVIRLSLRDPGEPETVPLPAAGFLLLGAMGGLVAAKRRRKA